MSMSQSEIFVLLTIGSIFKSSNYIFQSVVTTGFMAFANHQTTNTINSFIVIVQLREERLDTVGKKTQLHKGEKNPHTFPQLGVAK